MRATVGQIGAAAITLLAISLVTFGATSVRSPLDVARSAVGREATHDQLVAYARDHGFDKPLFERYGRWLGNFVRGDWGRSTLTNRPVRPELVPRFVKTLILAGTALLFAVPLAVALGIFMAKRVGTWPDVSALIATVVVAALPEFVIGIGLLFLLGITLGWLPIDSTGLAFGTLGDKVKAFLLPSLALAVAIVPHVARITRAAVRDALGAAYVQAAVLRGFSARRVMWNHVMRNAAPTVINVIAINLVYLLSGVIVVENVFAFPGVGQALVQAIGGGDTITVQAVAVVMGAFFVAISLVADLLTRHFNPRLRSQL
jgi:peptide/nickel transport system permease protein